jgi:hypothetical protein
MKTQTTKRPWKIEILQGCNLSNQITKSVCINIEGGSKIALLEENKEANAYLIVKAVNCHDKLVEALKNLIEACNWDTSMKDSDSLDKAKQALKESEA